MTKDKTPAEAYGVSDAELESLARQHGTGGWQTLSDMVRFARAVLASQPQPKGTAEPVAWRYEDARGHYRYVGHKPHLKNFAAEYAILNPVPLYAEPVQAPAPAPGCQHKRYSLDKQEQVGRCIDCGAEGRMVFVVQATSQDEPPKSATSRDCPHCNYTGTVHCGDVADKIKANGGELGYCSNVQVYCKREQQDEIPDYAVEINRLRNVIQAACTGGLDHMIERWKALFPDAPVPSVHAVQSPAVGDSEERRQLQHLLDDIVEEASQDGLAYYRIRDEADVLFSNMVSACARLLAQSADKQDLDAWECPDCGGARSIAP